MENPADLAASLSSQLEQSETPQAGPTVLDATAPDGNTLHIPVPQGVDKSQYGDLVSNVVNHYMSTRVSTLGALGRGLESTVQPIYTGAAALADDEPFSQESQEQEQLKDEAFKQHPIAYGAGKVGGIAGEAALAPELGLGNVADEAVTNAGISALGADWSHPKEAIGETATGGAIGGAAGKLGELVGKGADAAQDFGYKQVPGMLGISDESLKRLDNPMLKETFGADEVDNLNDLATNKEHGTGINTAFNDFLHNPENVKERVGENLYDRGLLNGSVSDAWANIEAEKNKAGSTISDILDQIKGKNGDVILDPGPIKQQFDQLHNAHIGDVLKSEKGLYAPYTDVDNALTTDLQSHNNKYISFNRLEEIRQQVGKQLGRLKVDSDKYPVYAKLYGALSDIRDDAVARIASSDLVNRPELAQQLLDANRTYSIMSRLSKDVTKQAFDSGEAGSRMIGLMGGMMALASGNLPRAAMYLAGGTLLGKVAQPLMENLNPKIISGIIENMPRLKAALPYLEKAATQGSTQLLFAHNQLQRTNPQYAQAMQDIQNKVTPPPTDVRDYLNRKYSGAQ